MLNAYSIESGALQRLADARTAGDLARAVWVDLSDPTPQEIATVESVVPGKIQLPERVDRFEQPFAIDGVNQRHQRHSAVELVPLKVSDEVPVHAGYGRGLLPQRLRAVFAAVAQSQLRPDRRDLRQYRLRDRDQRHAARVAPGALTRTSDALTNGRDAFTQCRT